MHYVYLNEPGSKCKRVEFENRFFCELQYTTTRDDIQGCW